MHDGSFLRPLLFLIAHIKYLTGTAAVAVNGNPLAAKLVGKRKYFRNFLPRGLVAEIYGF